jgi:hypothetical protein
VVSLDQTGHEAPLPQCPAAAMPCIECLHVRLPAQPHGGRHRANLVGRHEQMRVIIHQHEGMNVHAKAPTRLPQQAAIVMPIFVTQDDRAPVNAALDHVHWDTWNLQARLTRHGRSRDEKEAPSLLTTGLACNQTFLRQAVGQRGLITSVPFVVDALHRLSPEARQNMEGAA